MPERKHIKYKATLIEGNTKVRVQILEQSHRQSNFGNGKDGSYQFEHNNFTLFSYDCPANYKDTHEMYLRGRLTERDNEILILPLEKYERFKAAVQAYNKYFKG